MTLRRRNRRNASLAVHQTATGCGAIAASPSDIINVMRSLKLCYPGVCARFALESAAPSTCRCMNGQRSLICGRRHERRPFSPYSAFIALFTFVNRPRRGNKRRRTGDGRKARMKFSIFGWRDEMIERVKRKSADRSGGQVSGGGASAQGARRRKRQFIAFFLLLLLSPFHSKTIFQLHIYDDVAVVVRSLCFMETFTNDLMQG